MTTYEELSDLLSYNEGNIALTDWYLSNYTGYYVGHPMFHINEDNVLIIYTDNVYSVNLDVDMIMSIVCKKRDITNVITDSGAYSEFDHFMAIGVSPVWEEADCTSHILYKYKGSPIMTLWGNILTVYEDVLKKYNLILSHLVRHARLYLCISYARLCPNYPYDIEYHRNAMDDFIHLLSSQVPCKYHLWERTDSLISYDDKPVANISGAMIMIYAQSCDSIGIAPSTVKNMLGNVYPSIKYYYSYVRSRNVSRPCNNSEQCSS